MGYIEGIFSMKDIEGIFSMEDIEGIFSMGDIEGIFLMGDIEEIFSTEDIEGYKITPQKPNAFQFIKQKTVSFSSYFAMAAVLMDQSVMVAGATMPALTLTRGQL